MSITTTATAIDLTSTDSTSSTQSSTDVLLDFALGLRSKLTKRIKSNEVYRQHYAGNHPMPWLSAEWIQRFGQGAFRGFADNWTAVVVDSAAERLTVKGFTPYGDTSGAGQEFFKAVWLGSDMDAQGSMGVVETLMTGQSSIMVAPDKLAPGGVRMSWESADQVYVEEHPLTGHAESAVRCWIGLDGSEHMELWQPAAHMEWVNLKGKGWARAKELEANQLTFVPFVSIPNRPLLGGKARSDIEAAIPMQQTVNVAWAWLLGAGELASIPSQIVMDGAMPLLPVFDGDQQISSREPTDAELREAIKRRFHMLDSADPKNPVRIGQWQAADLQPYMDLINLAAKHLSAQTRTPIHNLVGEMSNVNGETLLALDHPLQSRVREASLHMTAPIRRAMAMAAQIAERPDVDAFRMGAVEWADPALHTMAQRADAAQKARAMGMALEDVLTGFLDYDPATAKAIAANAMAEANSFAVDKLAAGLSANVVGG